MFNQGLDPRPKTPPTNNNPRNNAWASGPPLPYNLSHGETTPRASKEPKSPFDFRNLQQPSSPTPSAADKEQKALMCAGSAELSRSSQKRRAEGESGRSRSSSSASYSEEDNDAEAMRDLECQLRLSLGTIKKITNGAEISPLIISYINKLSQIVNPPNPTTNNINITTSDALAKLS